MLPADFLGRRQLALPPLLTVERVGELGIKPGTVILGVTAGPNGDLYATDPAGGNIYQVKGSTLGTPSFNTKSDVRVFATGAAGANGIGFDGKGNLWISGGDQNALYVVGPRGGKVKTVLQILAISWYIWPFPDPLAAIGPWLMGIALLVTVATGVDYLIRVLRVRRAAAGPDTAL